MPVPVFNCRGFEMYMEDKHRMGERSFGCSGNMPVPASIAVVVKIDVIGKVINFDGDPRCTEGILAAEFTDQFPHSALYFQFLEL